MNDEEQDGHVRDHVQFHVFNWFKVATKDVVQKVQLGLFPHKKEVTVDQLNQNGGFRSNNTASWLWSNLNVTKMEINKLISQIFLDNNFD